MVLSYSAAGIEQGRPSKCVCHNSRFHRHGSYWRKGARVWVYRFICCVCRVTVSLVPSCCVPFKHHPVELISRNLSGVLVNGRSCRAQERAKSDVVHSTISRWVHEFVMQSGVLATEGMERLGMEPFSGSARSLFQDLFSRFGEVFLDAVQPLWCRVYPGLGIFRSFILRPS